MRKELIMCLVLTIGFLSPIAEMSAIEIISQGKSDYTIVVPDKALESSKLAATDLQRYLAAITGARLPIVAETKAPKSKRIFVGPCAVTAALGMKDFNKSSYEIKVVGKDLFIAGKDTKGNPLRLFSGCQTGSLYGVCELLRRIGKMRWLWPGALGTVITKSPNFHIEDTFTLKDEAYFRIRNLWMTYRNSKEVNERYSLWARRVGQGQDHSGNSGHAYAGLIENNKYFKEHPEYYALVGGERRPMVRGKHGWRGQICTSNEDVIRIATKNALKSKRAIVSLSPNDGGGFCECAECRALDDPKNIIQWGGKPMVALTDRIFTFVNAIARNVKKEQPDKLLGHYCYTFFKQPPTRIKKLEDNVVLFFAQASHWFRDPVIKKQYRGYIDKWYKLCSKMVSREYYGLCYWHDMPNIHTRLIEEDIDYLKTHNFIGVNSEASMNFATNGVNYYFAAKKLWDPAITREEVLKDYYQSGFGPAAANIAEYYDIFERRLETLGANAAGSGSANVDKLDMQFDDKTLAAAKLALNQAYAKTTDSMIRKRLDFIKIGYDYTETTAHLINTLRKLNAMGMSFNRLGSAKLKRQPTQKEFFATLEQGMKLHKKRWEIIDSQGELPAMHIAARLDAEKQTRWGEQLKSRYDLSLAARSGRALELPLQWRFSLDKSNIGEKIGWWKSDFKDSDWKLIKTNRAWEKQGYSDYNGIAWYRVDFKLTDKQIKTESALLKLGAVDESCWIWLNGEKIGEFIYDEKKDQSSWRNPLFFDVTGKLKVGKNVIALRVRDLAGLGGLWKPAFLMFKAMGKNLIKNGDFSESAKGWRIHSPKNDSYEFVESKNKKKGNSLKITVRKPLKKPLSISTNVIAIPKKRYTFSYRFKTNGLKPHPSIKGAACSRIIFRDNRGKSVTDTSGYIWARGNLPSNSEKWSERQMFFKTPAGTSKLHITIFFHSPGVYWFDDAQLRSIGK